MIHNQPQSVTVVHAPAAQAYPAPLPGQPYPQPAPGQPGYGQPSYQPTYPQTQPQQPAGNVVVVSNQPSTVVVQRERKEINHVLHLIISIFFWPWIIVWIVLCMMEDGKGISVI